MAYLACDTSDCSSPRLFLSVLVESFPTPSLPPLVSYADLLLLSCMFTWPIADRPVAFDIVLDLVIPRTLGEVTPESKQKNSCYTKNIVYIYASFEQPEK